MSMLTPQGLKGKQYRITGNSYPRLGRPPRKGRRIMALLGSLLALTLVAVGGVQLVHIFTGKGRHTAAQACATASAHRSGKPLAPPAAASAATSIGAPSVPASAAASGAPGVSGPPASPVATSTAVPQPQAVTVNVYNATATSGLAARTADELRQRGFVIGKVGNAPTALDKKVTASAQVISGPAGMGAATLVGAQVAGATTTTDGRTDASVDFVIGDGYTDLLGPTQAAAALTAATKPSPSPGPAGC